MFRKESMTKLINDNYKMELRRKLRKTMTKSETVLWKYIKGEQLLVKFRRQVSIQNYIVDFYCPQLKLIVEVDGSTHNEEEVFKKDVERDKILKDLGFEIIRYNSERIFNNLNEVLSDLYTTCEKMIKYVSKSQPNTPS